MLRKSNSSSHIPLPKKETRSRLPRSSSVSRLSQNNAVPTTGAIPKRNSSLDRKPSLSRLSKATPLALGKMGRTSSFQRTPSSTKSVSSRSPGSARIAERKTIQKLSSDKHWVADQFQKAFDTVPHDWLLNVLDIYGVRSLVLRVFEGYLGNRSQIVKIQRYIAYNQLDIAAPSLKPPSIRVFISFTSMLVQQMFPTNVKMSNENYKEIIGTTLKTLRYPGTIANSVLKTVNTMHAWPQVVGMWGWLIDKVNLTNRNNDPPIENLLETLNPEERQAALLTQTCKDLFCKRYRNFNDNCDNDEQAIGQINQEYLNKLCTILQVDHAEHRSLVNEVKEREQYKNKQEEEILRLIDEKSNIQSQIQKLEEEIAAFDEEDLVRDTEIDGELKYLKDKIAVLKERSIGLKENIDKLREAEKMQPCSLKEKLELKKKLEQLRTDVEIKKDKVEHINRIKENYDTRIAKEIHELQDLVTEWNKLIREWSIPRPNLKCLLLREKGFHTPEFMGEILKVRERLVEIDEELWKECQRIKTELEKQEMLKARMEMEMETLVQREAEALALSQKYALEYAEVKKEIQATVAEESNRKKSYQLEIAELKRNIKEQQEQQARTEEDLKAHRANLTAEVNKFGKKCLTFFLDLDKQVTENITEMLAMWNALKQKVLKEQQEYIDEQEEVLKLLDHLSKRTLENEGDVLKSLKDPDT